MVDETTEIEEDDPNESGLIRDLREKAKSGAKAEKRVVELERTMAFKDAGVPDSKMAGYFSKAYEGEMTSDAIRSAATEAGIIETAPEVQEAADDAAAHGAIQTAATGGGSNVGPSYSDELAGAKTEAAAIAVMVKHGVPVLGHGKMPTAQELNDRITADDAST